MKNLSIILILIFVSVQAFAGGPWPQPKGKGYFKFSEWWTVFDQHFTDTGLKDPNVTTGIFNTNFYGEYGISNELTGIINANLFSRNYMNNLRSGTTNELLVEGESLNSLGDIDVGLKYGLVGGNIPVSISAIFGIPTGKVGGGSQGNLQTGDGEFNQMIQIDAGSGFKIGNLNAYTSAYVGFNNRTKGFSEEFRYGLEFGLSILNNKLWLISRLNTVESLKNGETAATVNSTSIFANNTEFMSLGFEASYYVSRNIGISLGYAGAFRGEIIAAAPSYSVGVFYDLNR